jgi:hypothetical protein
MMLLVGEPDDLIVTGVAEILRRRSSPFCFVSEGDLLGCTPLVLRRGATGVDGELRLGGTWHPLDAIAGVLLRPLRRWWPDSSFSLADQVFVYHETIAAWIAVLKSLRCPVVNDFGLGWWLRDGSDGVRLRQRLATALGLPFRLPGSDPASIPDQTVRIDVVDGAVVDADADLDGLATRLDAARVELRAWQEASGLRIVRLELARADPPVLLEVDPLPMVGVEGGPIATAVAALLLEERR